MVVFAYQGAEATDPGTINIHTAGGGDCFKIGTWSQSTLTCNMNQDVEMMQIVIQGDGFTLNGNNTSLIGAGDSYCNDSEYNGIEIDDFREITIKDLSISGYYNGLNFDELEDSNIINVKSNNNCHDGINLQDSSDNTFSNVEANNNDDDGLDMGGGSELNSFLFSKFIFNGDNGILLTESSNSNQFSDNVVNDNGNEGIELQNSSLNSFLKNSVLRNADSGFDVESHSDENAFTCNQVKFNGVVDDDGAGFEISHSEFNNIIHNVVEGNPIGIGLYDNAKNNSIIDNNIIDNTIPVNDESNEDNNIFQNHWGGDNPLDDPEPRDALVDLSECEFGEDIEPEPITGIECTYNDPVDGVLSENTLDFTVDGTCDIYRGEDMEIKNMTLVIFKEIIPVDSDEASSECDDQIGEFTIYFDDESGELMIDEEGKFCDTAQGAEFFGNVTGVEGTEDYGDISLLCGHVNADITLGEDTAVNNSIRTLSNHIAETETDVIFGDGNITLNPCALLGKAGNGGDNQWDTRPSFGISHEDRQNQVVENGFSFNSEYFTLTDNHHTDFAEQSVDIGTVNSFSATVYADKKLKIQEFLFGIPNVGEAHLAELGVEVWYDRDGEIEDVKVVQKSDVIDADTVSVSHEKVKCLAIDAEANCDTTTVSMKFLEPLKDKVMAIKAIDYALRDHRTFLNEGFDISGDSLNPMLSSMIPSNVRGEGLLQVTQMAKYSPYWVSENGRMFEMNSFGSFKEINQSFERFQDTGDARDRMHSGFGGILQYEQNRATDLFDSSNYISEIPESFTYIYPETGQRISGELLEEMILQQEIAQRIVDEMDKQQRNY